MPARTIAFNVLAWALSILLSLLFVGTTILTLTMWFAGHDSLTNPVTDLGFFALGGLVIVPGVAVQISAAHRHLAGMQQALIGALVLSLAGLVGARIEPLVGGLIFFVAVLLLALLDPVRRELARSPAECQHPTGRAFSHRGDPGGQLCREHARLGSRCRRLMLLRPVRAW